jgi:hypothetical protein
MYLPFAWNATTTFSSAESAARTWRLGSQSLAQLEALHLLVNLEIADCNLQCIIAETEIISEK